MLQQENSDKVIELKENIICEDPLVYTIDNYISNEECDHMIEAAKPTLADSVVSDDKGGYVSKGRTSKNSWLAHDHDKVCKELGERISKLVKIPIQNSERFQVVYYAETNEYRQHYDAWDHDGSAKALRCIRHGGQRMLTALVYLNTVEEGGGTSFPKLKKEVKAEKGKLLVFENVLKNTNIKHPLSEHAGLPVIKGEKYIFNLWFRECSRTMLYKDFNPKYYENLKSPEDTVIVDILDIEGLQQIIDSKNVFKSTKVLSEDECNGIIKKSNLVENKNSNSWVNKINESILIKKIEKLTNIDSRFYENINVVKYIAKNTHGPFYDAYDINTQRGKDYTARLGQRMSTISIVLRGTMHYKFENLKTEIEMKEGTLLYYDNVFNSRQRDKDMNHFAYNKSDEELYILNIYIREKDANGNLNTLYDFLKKENAEIVKKENTENIKLDIQEKENYMESYHHVLKLFEDKKINNNWKSYKSFSYIFKGNLQNVSNYVINFKKLVDRDKGLNKKLLDVDYNFDEFNPVNLNDTVHPELLELLQKYYRESITGGVFPLGDRQSNRYRSNNEPISRFLHYEMLPIIEKITKQTLRPTYTYLSSYIKECDLPAHTDREDCEYTVSFLVNKDKDWPIYLHKVKQPEKHKGRTPDRYLPKDECIELNGESGGFIIFCGCDHAHYREKYEGEFYDILLLHYRCV
jgi:prolyl 4-hydroxylase